MNAIRLHGVGDVRLDEVASPGLPGPDEVLVAPLWCGLCGTDAREYFGPGGAVPDAPHPLTGVSKPVVLGHEFSARVVALGRDVDGPPEGTTVAIMPLVTCGRCAACVGGEPLLCPDKAWTGLSTATGGLGDLALVRRDQISTVDGLTARQAALVEPAAVAVEAVTRSGMGGGETVLVVGCGPIGALAIMASLGVGAARVLATDPDPERRRSAAALGAEVLDRAVDSRSDLSDLIGAGVDVAIDCAGKPASIDLAIASLRPGGRVVVPSVHPEPRVVDLWGVTRRVLTITGSLGYTQATWQRTIDLIAAGRLPVERIVSRLIAREEIVEAGFEQMRPEAAGGLKTLVRVSDLADD